MKTDCLVLNSSKTKLLFEHLFVQRGISNTLSLISQKVKEVFCVVYNIWKIGVDPFQNDWFVLNWLIVKFNC